MSAIEQGARALPMRVIVADDDPIFRSLVRAQLGTRAEEIVEAADGLEAWSHILSLNFQLALIDLSMPNLDGIALIQCIRGHPRTRHLPVIVITSRDDKESVDKALSAGATSFLTKPVNWSMFVHHIDYLLKLSRDAQRARSDVEQARAASRVKDALFAALGYEVAETSARMLKTIRKRQRTIGAQVSLDEVLADFELLADETGRLRDVLSGLMPHVRTVADRVVRSEELCPLDEVMRQAVGMVSDQANVGGVDIQVAPLPELLIVCDPAAVATAIANPLANAISHSSAGQRVSVSTRHFDGDFLIVEIEDQGTGMTTEQITRALSPLDGPDIAFSNSISGLGVPLAKAIMEAHGGKIEIRSMPQEGTTVTLVFPADRVERSGGTGQYDVAI